MKNSNYIMENRTGDLPACSAVPQSTAPPCVPVRRAFLENVRETVANLIVKFLFSVKLEGSQGPAITRKQNRHFRCYLRHNHLEMTFTV